MSLLFDGTDDYALDSTPPVTAPPFSVSLWFKRAEIAAALRQLCHIGISASALDCFAIQIATTGALRMQTSDASAASNATTSTTGAGDTNWHHALGVVASSTSRAIYLDGGGKGTNATSRVPATSTLMRIGLDPVNNNDFNGNIAHVAVWNTALSDADAVSLAAGASPFSISAGLVSYYPMTDAGNALFDVVSGRTLTLGGNTAYNSTDPTVLTSRIGFVPIARGISRGFHRGIG